MAKWTEEMIVQLKELCGKGVPNNEIATELNVPIAEVYAKRSHLGITIDKVAAKGKAEFLTDNGDRNRRITCRETTMTKCNCCGFMIDADDAQPYIMQDGSEQQLCARCAAVLEWERDFCESPETE